MHVRHALQRAGVCNEQSARVSVCNEQCLDSAGLRTRIEYKSSLHGAKLALVALCFRLGDGHGEVTYGGCSRCSSALTWWSTRNCCAPCKRHEHVHMTIYQVMITNQARAVQEPKSRPRNEQRQDAPDHANACQIVDSITCTNVESTGHPLCTHAEWPRMTKASLASQLGTVKTHHIILWRLRH